MQPTNLHLLSIPLASPRRLSAATVLMFAGIVFGGRSSYGATCFVPTGGTYHYPTIQTAVNDSRCTTIRVEAGTHYGAIQISRDINIIGSGAANTIIDASKNRPVIAIASGAVRLDGLTLKNGWYGSNDLAGGISDLGTGNLYVLNCVVTGNYGNGIGVSGGAVRIEDSTVSTNNGHGIRIHNAAVTIRRTTIVDNRADGVAAGGEGSLDNSTVAISNSTITRNFQAAINSWSSVSVSSSTIAENPTTLAGFGTVTVKSSILSSNTYGLHCSRDLRIIDRGYNLRWPGFNDVCPGSYLNPSLGSLTNNGGLNETMMPLSGSAAIGRGACSDATGVALPVDARLHVRPASACDAGAVESRSSVDSAPDAAWYKLDEGSGNTAHDSSPRAATAAVYSSGPPAWYTEQPTAAAPTVFYNAGSLYSGAYNTWVQAPLATTKTDNVSAAMWVNCGGCSTYSHDFVIFYNGEFRWDGFGLYLPTGSRHVELIVNGAVHDSGYTLPSTFTWTHLAVVRSSGAWQLYVNGRPVGSSWNWTPNTPVGTTSIGADPFGGENFGGIVDDVRVYSRALLPGEIAWVATGDR